MQGNFRVQESGGRSCRRVAQDAWYVLILMTRRRLMSIDRPAFESAHEKSSSDESVR